VTRTAGRDGWPAARLSDAPQYASGAQVKDTALTIISQQIRIEENELKAPGQDEPLIEYYAAVQAFEASEKRRQGGEKPKGKRGKGDPD
jgi:hypothetical protein